MLALMSPGAPKKKRKRKELRKLETCPSPASGTEHMPRAEVEAESRLSLSPNPTANRD